MSFKPSDDFMTAWTSRTVMQARENALAYNIGNRESEHVVQTNQKYKIADPTITVTEETRARDASTGALSDFTPLTSDSAALKFIDVEAIGSRVFREQIDQKDIQYVKNVVSIPQLQEAMANSATKWTDNSIWQAVKGGVKSSNKTALTSGDAKMSRSTQKVTGGTKTEKLALGEAIYDWIDDLALAVAVANIDPGVGEGDTGIPQVVMSVGPMKLLQQFILSKQPKLDDIQKDGLVNAPSVNMQGRWLGRLAGIDLFTSNADQLRATASAAGSTQANVFHLIAAIPQRSWDNALVTYRAEYAPPDARSAKGVLAQEQELWHKVVEEDYLWQATLPSAA